MIKCQMQLKFLIKHDETKQNKTNRRKTSHK